MRMNAIAIVKIDPAVVTAALPALAGEGLHRGEDGAPVRVRALEDATLVYLDAPLTEEPDLLGMRLVAKLGDLLLAHLEPRGVPAFPESYALAATRWDAALAELGDAAEWLPLPRAAATMPDLSALLGAGAPAGLAGLAAHLETEAGAAMLEQAMQMAQRLASSGALDDLAARMRAGGDPTAAFSNASAPGGMDLGAMMAQAQSMLAADPELERMLRAQLGADPDDGDGEGGEER
ncbi:MAG: hypothetical protein KF729_00230 [Sandaracinaceae bacterium]|nr:hypothetical protein [Sandaracinaceae bacterium]